MFEHVSAGSYRHSLTEQETVVYYLLLNVIKRIGRVNSEADQDDM